MIRVLKKLWWLILGGLGIGVYIVLKKFGLKQKVDVISYRAKLDKKLLDIDLDKDYKIKEIESKAKKKKKLMREAMKIPDKRKRLRKLADILNNTKS